MMVYYYDMVNKQPLYIYRTDQLAVLMIFIIQYYSHHLLRNIINYKLSSRWIILHLQLNISDFQNFC